MIFVGMILAIGIVIFAAIGAAIYDYNYPSNKNRRRA